MTVVLTTVALIILSAFFVAVEFSLMAVRRHRLEQLAEHSASARAALRSARELTLILAGAQLGITVCTLALGAVTKPAVHAALLPLLERLGLPLNVADVASFILALIVVTFLHLVIGEMAPKSWALAHPERSALFLALPMRAFMTLTRPVLRALNGSANWLLRRLGIEPVDELATGQDEAGLRHLVEHSANVGALAPSFGASITTVLDLREDTIADIVSDEPLNALPDTASVGQVQDLSRRTGHLRIPLLRGGAVSSVVHVRDTLVADHADADAATFGRDPYFIDGTTSLEAALTAMRTTGHHLAVVRGMPTLTVVTIADILARLFPPDAADGADSPTTR